MTGTGPAPAPAPAAPGLAIDPLVQDLLGKHSLTAVNKMVRDFAIAFQAAGAYDAQKAILTLDDKEVQAALQNLNAGQQTSQRIAHEFNRITQRGYATDPKTGNIEFPWSVFGDVRTAASLGSGILSRVDIRSLLSKDPRGDLETRLGKEFGKPPVGALDRLDDSALSSLRAMGPIGSGPRGGTIALPRQNGGGTATYGIAAEFTSEWQ